MQPLRLGTVTIKIVDFFAKIYIHGIYSTSLNHGDSIIIFPVLHFADLHFQHSQYCL